MKRQTNTQFIIIILLFSNIFLLARAEDDQETFFAISRETSILELNSGLNFNTTLLNWTFQAAFQWISDPEDLWTYYHFNITSSYSKVGESYLFNFTFMLDINNEQTDEKINERMLLGDSILIDPFWDLKIELFHENLTDIGFLWLSNPTNDSKSGSYSQSLEIFQQSSPIGFKYTSRIGGKGFNHYYGRGSLVEINSSELNSFYDGNTLWVKDLTNFSYETNFYFKDFDLLFNFSGSYNVFLGDGISHANSSINMEYKQALKYNPTIIPKFNITLSLTSIYSHLPTQGTIHSSTDRFKPEIVFNQSNYDSNLYTNLNYYSENSEYGSWLVINDTNVPESFNSSFFNQKIIFQLSPMLKEISLEMEVKQFIMDESDQQFEREIWISSFPLVNIMGWAIFSIIGVISILKLRKMEISEHRNRE